jgi:hypothetical protein
MPAFSESIPASPSNTVCRFLYDRYGYVLTIGSGAALYFIVRWSTNEYPKTLVEGSRQTGIDQSP